MMQYWVADTFIMLKLPFGRHGRTKKTKVASAFQNSAASKNGFRLQGLHSDKLHPKAGNLAAPQSELHQEIINRASRKEELGDYILSKSQYLSCMINGTPAIALVILSRPG